MLAGDVVKVAVNATLEQGEKAFRRVRGHFAARVLPHAVVNRMVPAREVLANAVVGRMLIGHDRGGRRNLILDGLVQRLSRHVRHNPRADATMLLYKGHNGRLVTHEVPTVPARLAADESFVYRHVTA